MGKTSKDKTYRNKMKRKKTLEMETKTPIQAKQIKAEGCGTEDDEIVKVEWDIKDENGEIVYVEPDSAKIVKPIPGGDFNPKSQSRITRIGTNNKRSKAEGWGEFELIFGNRLSAKSNSLKNEKKLKYSFFMLALNTENVTILEQQMEYLQLRPNDPGETLPKDICESNEGNALIECPECEYKSTKKLMLEHMLVHIEEYFLCEKCDAKCSDITELRKHMMGHTSYLPFACTECDFLCAKPEEIRDHIASHKNIRSNSY